MMELSSYQSYGCLFLRELRRRNPDSVSGPDLMALGGIRADYTKEIMRGLLRAGLVVSKKGPGGGYRLKDPRHRVTVWEVIQAFPDKRRPSQISVPAEEMRGRVSLRLKACLVRVQVDSL